MKKLGLLGISFIVVIVLFFAFGQVYADRISDCKEECWRVWVLECNKAAEHWAAHGMCQVGYDKCMRSCK